MSNATSSFAASRQAKRHSDGTFDLAGTRVRLLLAALLAGVSCLLLAALPAAAPAAAGCPNEVFRSGPSAKLPECRAYELITPEYTGGIKPLATNFSNYPHSFEFPLINDAGDSVSFNTVGGAFSGDPGSGFSDRYRARRTATGWVTEFVGPNVDETSRPAPGAVGPDHEYYFFNAGLNDFVLEPDSLLQAPYGGEVVDYLRLPNGQSELIGLGDLGSSQRADGRLITAGGTHVIFTTGKRLEPEASPEGMTTIYDRAVGGETHVVSLLPNGSAPTEGQVTYLGASASGNDILFEVNGRWYVRRNNSVTKEVARPNGVAIGKELSCEGSGSTTLAYQWLRNGAPIGGETGATYTPSSADSGTAVQCLVTATGPEAETLAASLPPTFVQPFGSQAPPFSQQGPTIATTAAGFASVGDELSCSPGTWEGSPSYAYQWLRDGDAIAGATGSTYLVTAADEGEPLQCRLTASNGGGTVLAFSPFVPIRPTLPAAGGEGAQITNVTEAGDAPEAGDELSCDPGTWSGSPSFSYQWLRDGAPVAGANAATYPVAAADEGATLQCVVTAETAGGDVQDTSNRLVVDPQPGEAPPQELESSGAGRINGAFRAEVGDSLFCDQGFWEGEPTYAFQWLRDGDEIAAATESFYVVTAADVGSVIQCRVTATNAGGTTTAIYGGDTNGARFATGDVPEAGASVPTAGLVFGGIFGGHVFYGDRTAPGLDTQGPGDLYSYDLAGGTTSEITDTGDAKFAHVSRDGSHVYFVSQSAIGGEGTAGAWNLYVWSRAGDNTTYIATVEPGDVEVKRESQSEFGANTASWAFAMDPDKESVQGLANSYTRATPDGSVFLFVTTAQLTSFNNLEATPEDCQSKETSGDRCPEAYRYDTVNDELTCVSCPPQGGGGPATGRVFLHEWGPVTNLNPPNNLTQDGNMVIFESSEDLLPQDGNGRRDVYRWKKGEGLALISTGQEVTDSYIYGITPSGSDIAFLTSQKLLPQDENGGAERLYDARVNGGFPPPDDSVTEPCSGDACQGNPSAAPETPSVPSTSLNGAGNVKSKLKCPKSKRKVVRKGKERCVKRNKGKQQRGKKRAGKQGGGKKAGAKRGANR